MNRISNSVEKIKQVPYSNFETLEDLTKKITKIIKGQREIMFSDIINFILRENCFGESYKQIILWCNYNIRLGRTFIESK